MSRSRRFLARIALAVGATAVGLAISEGVARTISFQTTGRWRDEPWINTEMYRQVPGRGYEHVPNSTEQINELGLRGPTRSAEKPAGAFRLLVLGDSVAYGIGVDPEETFAAVLEAHLASRFPGRVSEVLNAGVVGYNTMQELDWLENRGLALAPDAVVLAYCPNDVQSTPIVFLEGDRFVFFRPGQPPRSLDSWLYRNSALFRLCNFGLDRIRVVSGGETKAAGGEDPGAALDMAGNLEALASLAKLLRERDIPLLVLIFPYLDGPFDEYPEYLLRTHLRATEIARAEGANIIDLLHTWKPYDYASLRLAHNEHDSVHPNAQGHALAAKQIAAWLTARSLPE